MDAFMREPVPPARTRNPVLPNPVNSSDADDWCEVEDAAAALAGGREMMALSNVAGRKAAENGKRRRNWSHSIIIAVVDGGYLLASRCLRIIVIVLLHVCPSCNHQLA
mmetsp:Transcript_15956/g.34750  ORF Transcript_15956/g.34750 Transcript_15956/m.34750 type:complete len:108 (-) Transcript_15956:2-325(-)